MAWHVMTQASQEDVLACLRSLTNLRQLLTAQLQLSSDTLVALMSLTALTKLHLVAAYPTVRMDAHGMHCSLRTCGCQFRNCLLEQ